MMYGELKTGIRNHLNNAAEDFFMVGYYLRQISENTLFIEDGYKSIWDFAKGEYGLSTSSASRFMAINARFSIDGGEHMDQKYIGMGPSKLQEMLGLTDEDLEKVTQETTVKELRAMKAAKLSYYKLPKTEYEEGSLLTTPGCGHKHDCFSCCHPCNIRQEDRLCVVSTIAEGRRCPNITEDFLKDVEAGMYKDDCQFMHLELAETRSGDNEPSPCCRACQHKGLCFSCCDVAKKEYEKEKENEAKKIKAEMEAKKPDPTRKDIESFYQFAGFCTSDDISADILKKKYKNSGGGGGIFLKDYEGSSRGIRINHKKEITYAQLAKELKEIQEEHRREEIAHTKDQEPNADDLKNLFYYWDLDATPDPERDLDPKELKRCHRYESAYSGNLTITCEASGVIINGKKRITWLKLSKALTEIFNSILPEDGQKKEPEPEAEKDPDIIDAEFKEVGEPEQQEPEEIEEQEPEEPVEVVDPEHYERRDVRDLKEAYGKELEIYKENQMPENTIRKIKILLDAVTLLDAKMEAEEAADD